MQRRDFIKLASGAAAASLFDHPANAAPLESLRNIIVIIADQRHYGLSRGTGYKFNTSPTLDRMQSEGLEFARNYCTTPLCVPSRISMLTGRWPDAHRVRMNLDPQDAKFEQDLYGVAKEQGYKTALAGKNHTYLKPKDVDFWREYTHVGGYIAPDAPPEVKQYEAWLRNLNSNIALEPSPFGVETQLPYRIVSDSIEFIDNAGAQPFLLQVSFPEPHDPEQVPKPYWNMFPPSEIPQRCAGPEALAKMGPRARWEYRLQQDHFPDTEKEWRRYMSNYLGALRMIDDQIARLMQHLKSRSLDKNTIVIFTTDHGDYLMHYGLARKGVGLYEDLTHTPLIWWGNDIRPGKGTDVAFTSMADVMPTLCEVMGAEIPHGVQGRSLWPLLKGERFPEEEFRSIYTSVGLGGLYYEDEDHIPTSISHDIARPGSWDELNKVTQSGNQKMVRMRDWKLVYDMMGYGAMYDLRSDPYELKNLFGSPEHAKTQSELMAELAMWMIRAQDSLPTGPQNGKYQTKWPAKHNWYTPYRHGVAPVPYLP